MHATRSAAVFGHQSPPAPAYRTGSPPVTPRTKASVAARRHHHGAVKDDGHKGGAHRRYTTRRPHPRAHEAPAEACARRSRTPRLRRRKWRPRWSTFSGGSSIGPPCRSEATMMATEPALMAKAKMEPPRTAVTTAARKAASVAGTRGQQPDDGRHHLPQVEGQQCRRLGANHERRPARCRPPRAPPPPP